jgi:prepilin-type N-terminal cleavage/methylation domain-containing protein/prepilin-type processing-associated H-X9-DG protein
MELALHNPDAFFPPARPAGRRRGFTLIELLVVVAIIALLVSILLPSLSAAKGMAKRTVCETNLRGIGLATQYYMDANNYFPPAWINSTCRWMDLVKSYADKTSNLYRCPSDAKQIACTWDPDIILSYGVSTFNFKDNAHCFWYGVMASDVCRPAGTIIFADCTPGLYYCGGGSTFTTPVPYVDCRHLNGTFSTVFCDGHAAPESITTQLDWDASQ